MTAQKKFIPFALYFAILFLSIWILFPYIKIGLWALIITISVWPFYKHWSSWFQRYQKLSALSFTILITFVILLPIGWIIYITINELIVLLQFLMHLKSETIQLPNEITSIPHIGPYLQHIWHQYVQDPQMLQHILASIPKDYLHPTEIASAMLHLTVSFFFTLLIVFFLLLRGDQLSKSLSHITEAYAPQFSIYLEKAVLVIRSVLYSMIYTGLGTGILLGIVYYSVGAPLPAFFAILSVLATVIPFGLAFILLLVTGILVIELKFKAAMIVAIIGTIVSLAVDNWARPALVEKYVSMHFLAAFFGAFGGMAAFGLIGIYIGPIMMMLLTLTWSEIVTNADEQKSNQNPSYHE